MGKYTGNYLTYPCRTMKITQSYTGNYSHSPHNTGTPKDYPIDEACENSGRSWMYCPCDEMVVKRVRGLNDADSANTFWLESTKEVLLADGTSNYVTLMVIHPEDEDLKLITVGKIFRRDEPICREGADGKGVTGNHFHFSVGKGKMTNNGWVENSNGKWVLSCSNGAQKPETMFYIDPSFTNVIQTLGLAFKNLPNGAYDSSYPKPEEPVVPDIPENDINGLTPKKITALFDFKGKKLYDFVDFAKRATSPLYIKYEDAFGRKHLVWAGSYIQMALLRVSSNRKFDALCKNEDVLNNISVWMESINNS